MPTIFDYVNAKEIAAYVTNAPENKMPYLGETLFPAKKQLGIDLKWIKGSQGLPVAISPANYDAKATLRERIGFKSVQTEMPFFREGMRVGEKDRQEINRLIQLNNSAYLTPLLNHIFDDITKLVEGARVQAERMRMQLLSTGSISISANRIAYDYDYKFDATHKFTIANKWDTCGGANDVAGNAAQPDPVEDIRAALDKVEEDTGNRPTSAICTRTTFNYLLKSNKIRSDMFLTTGTVATLANVSEQMVKTYLADKLGLTIAVYTKKYALLGDDGKATGSYQYFPDNVFTLIPSGNLGSTYFGTTPEEADLMNGVTEADVSVVNTGIAVATIKEPHPVNVFTIVSGIFLPSFENIDSVGIMTVA